MLSWSPGFASLSPAIFSQCLLQTLLVLPQSNPGVLQGSVLLSLDSLPAPQNIDFPSLSLRSAFFPELQTHTHKYPQILLDFDVPRAPQMQHVPNQTHFLLPKPSSYLHGPPPTTRSFISVITTTCLITQTRMLSIILDYFICSYQMLMILP